MLYEHEWLIFRVCDQVSPGSLEVQGLLRVCHLGTQLQRVPQQVQGNHHKNQVSIYIKILVLQLLNCILCAIFSLASLSNPGYQS